MRLHQHILAIVGSCLTIVVALVALFIFWMQWKVPYFHWWVVGSWLVLLTLSLSLTHFAINRTGYMLRALEIGLLNFKDGDFSNTLPEQGDDELANLAQLCNEVGEILRKERQTIYQRELLLDKVIQSSPLAMVLTDDNHRILYCNFAARHLFNEGRKSEGLDFHQLVAKTPENIRQAIHTGKDGLFSVTEGEEEQTYHLSLSQFLLNARHHHLYLFRQMTRELNRQEVAIWKKVIRVISHELNNSLAPLSSMAHSGKLLCGDDKKLNLIFNTFEDRVKHLTDFIHGYARFSKLPMPQRKAIEWPVFIEGLKQQVDFNVVGELPKSGFFDPAQIEQVLINLFKNAKESGSEVSQIDFAIKVLPKAFLLTVADRGSGMSDSVLQNALLPFYSTKQTGTGLGLPLCREIVEAHEGKINISNRVGGGLTVSIWLSR